MPETFIQSLDDPRLDPYRHLRSQKVTPKSGRFIAEGKFVVQRLIESDFQVESVLLSDHRRTTFAPMLPPNTTVYIVPKALAHLIVGFNFHTGVLACGLRKPNPDLAAVLKELDATATVVVCPHMVSPENLGAILRLSAAFGVNAALLGPACADPYSRRVLRVSMANVFRLTVVRCDALADCLAQLRDRWGFELAATVSDGRAIAVSQATRPARLALLFGNEAHGLDSTWLSICQHHITIPMAPGVDSLNVANAAAIVLHHFTRAASQLS